MTYSLSGSRGGWAGCPKKFPNKLPRLAEDAALAAANDNGNAWEVVVLLRLRLGRG